MIAVRIPKEIKEYKEKILLGMTARQLISVILILSINIPAYLFGRKYINEEVLSYAVMLNASLLGGFGFVTYNGLTFEKLLVVIFKQLFLYPQKRKFVQNNFFEEIQNEAEKEEKQMTAHEYKKYLKMKQEAGLEKAFLLLEAEQQGKELGLKEIQELDEKLITVKSGGSNPNKNPKKTKKNNKQGEKGKSKLQQQAEAIKEKQEEDPFYVPTTKESKILLKYAQYEQKKRKQEVQSGKKQVKKKSTTMSKRRRAKTSIPKSVQDTIPYIADYEEGLFEVAPNRYSKTIEMRDINYMVAKEEEQIAIFCKYGEFLNYFTEDMNLQITIHNQVVAKKVREQQVLYPMAGDRFDRHRKEYNRILRRQMVAGNNEIQQSKYCTITIDAENPYEALLKFHKIQSEVLVNLQKMGVKGRVLSTDERLAIMHDIFRKGKEGELKVDYDWIKKQGLSSKDYIAPSDFRFMRNLFNIDSRFCKVMVVSNLPASLSDDFLNDLNDCEFPLMTTLNIEPVAQDKALRLIKRQLTGMEANKIEMEKKALRSGYSPDTISHDLKQSLAQAEELLDDMINKNQKLYFVTITVLIMAETEEDLQDQVDTLVKKARAKTCQLMNLSWQQEDAFKQTLPMGINHLSVKRTLTTESASIFMPFNSSNLYEPKGFYYGINQITRNLILLDRTHMKTPSGFILGSSGSGKSFATKREILNVLLHDNETSVLIIDPDNEYASFVQAFGGTVINIAADSQNFINPMDMALGYAEEGLDPITSKSEYIMTIVEIMLSSGNGPSGVGAISATQKTLIDKCVRRCYKKYRESGMDEQYTPTFLDLQEEFDKEKEKSGTEDAREIAEGVEYYTKGSMNIFAHKSNVEYNNRLVVFNIQSLGSQLKAIGLLVVMEFCWNRMLKGKAEGNRVYLYIDEIHSLFQNDFSARYLQQFYKRGRKYGLVVTGITQNMEDLLNSDMARGMIGNSDFIMMLNQAPEDLKVLASMLNISETQMGFVSMSEAGSGLLFAEDTIIPFSDRFPTDSYLYRLMSTKFGEEDDVDAILQEILEESDNIEKTKK